MKINDKSDSKMVCRMAHKVRSWSEAKSTKKSKKVTKEWESDANE